jgi:predicted metal-dependent HD superfamily phosphohydrolase
MLALAEEVLNGIADRQAFILGLLFRDAVCRPGRADGAAEGARLMRALLARRVPEAVLARAESMILAAARHQAAETPDPSLRGDSALFADIGLAVLGAEEARYDAYEAALRREHAHLRDDAWGAGRSASLQMLLWRDRIYLTDRFFLDREKRARRNLARAIARLRGTG